MSYAECNTLHLEVYAYIEQNNIQKVLLPIMCTVREGKTVFLFV
jgi:hypothetical protein